MVWFRSTLFWTYLPSHQITYYAPMPPMPTYNLPSLKNVAPSITVIPLPTTTRTLLQVSYTNSTLRWLEFRYIETKIKIETPAPSSCARRCRTRSTIISSELAVVSPADSPKLSPSMLHHPHHPSRQAQKHQPLHIVTASAWLKSMIASGCS
jgi:hypothetical protein